MSNRIAPKLLAEFIGTFALIFIGAGAGAVVGDGVGLPGPIAIAFAHGLTVMAFAFAYGSVSGGHFNPRSLWECSLPARWAGGRCPRRRRRRG
jgi:glycerol uptake facilitator-like aquaporin